MAQVINFFHRIATSYQWWQIAIELLFIGSCVFWVLRFLQGTRGARMLKGIGFMLISLYLIVNFAATTFHLDRISYLYNNCLFFAGVAAVIAFQQELRRALMRLGETRIFGSLTREVGSEIEELVQCAVFLSLRKIGGLIAIEREVGLGGITESGTRINADLTADLLNTIFFPNSPLHDLGVVVSHGRIAYAGVQFPLAESGELEKDLGSRHRAAVGLSQESDALVLVVSEETGSISLAESGRLIRHLSAETLRAMLRELLGGAESVLEETELA